MELNRTTHYSLYILCTAMVWVQVCATEEESCNKYAFILKEAALLEQIR